MSESVQELTAVLLRAASVAEREDAAERLGALGNPDAGSALLAVLDGDEHWLRVKAIVALGLLGYRAAAAALVEIAGDDRWECWHTRTEAMDALARVGFDGVVDAPEVLEVLVRVLREQGDPDIQICAARALGALGMADAVVALRMTAARTSVSELAAAAREAMAALAGSEPSAED